MRARTTHTFARRHSQGPATMTATDRRSFLLATAAAGLGLPRAPLLRAADASGAPAPDPVGDPVDDPVGDTATGAEPFDFDRLVDLASTVAADGYREREQPLKGDFATLDHDRYQDIRFARDADPLAPSGAGFGLDLLPQGFLFTSVVDVALVRDGVATPLPFDVDDLEFGPLAPRPSNPAELGWSGFRLRSPVNRPDVLDEVAVFQGASYFRAVARGQRYGLSARGLAVGVASERGEEFPEFTRFWVQVPAAEDASIVVFALLDSPSVAGAYRFELIPGEETVMQVRSVLFPRTDLDDVGVAPLTSMFLFDPASARPVDDYRPAVHDSDALRMIGGDGERLLRSLANGAELQISTFEDVDPVAFGLVQRRRRFEDYEDAEARYDLRPGAWVQPTGGWGAGQVVLVEIPTDAEIHDNVVAYWRPARTLVANERQVFDYRLSWTDAPSDDAPLLRVSDVRSGALPGGEARRFVVDFRAPDGAAGGGAGTTRIELTASSGGVSNVTGRILEANGDYRAIFDYDPADARSADLRLQLRSDSGPASETWLYRWSA